MHIYFEMRFKKFTQPSLLYILHITQMRSCQEFNEFFNLETIFNVVWSVQNRRMILWLHTLVT